MPARPSGKHGSKQGLTIGMGSHWAENNRTWRAQHHCDTTTKETSRVLYHSSFTSVLFRTTSFQTFTTKTPGFQFTRYHGTDKKCKTISLFQDYSSIQSPVLLRTTFFSYVSFLEKRPGFKFTRYHGTDDWSSSSQVKIPLDRKVSLQAWIQTQHLETCLKSWHLW